MDAVGAGWIADSCRAELTIAANNGIVLAA
jgi:hypothetical protein